MDKFKMGMNILSGVFSLVRFAERWFSGKPKSGREKKAMVIEGVKELVGNMEGATTGGAHETWSKIEKELPAIIDNAAGVLYLK